MELPCKEEDEEEVVSIPELLKVGATALLHSEPNHDAKTCSHNPASGARPSGKVCLQEDKNTLASGLCVGIKHSKFLKVAHMSGNMDNRKYDHGPCCRFVEGDVFVKWNELVQRGATKERDEITTDGQKDEDDISV